MTKYILHGGNSNIRSESNDAFYKEIVRSNASSEVNILCVYFARPEGRWEDSYAEDQSSLLATGRGEGVIVNTALATYDMDELLQQIYEADIIFINGGRKGHLKETLQRIPNLPELFNNRIVVGISAGANVLTKYYYSSVAQTVREGIGILPLALLTHSDRDAAHEEELRRACGSLPIYKIAEEHYTTLES